MPDKPHICSQCQGKVRHRESPALGLDELMIVNPGAGGAPDLFLGEDGALYQVLGESGESLSSSDLFLGDDGSVYRADPVPSTQPSLSPSVASDGVGAARADDSTLGGYLLAADGTLYEVTKSASH
jgi:hypothetical protein